MGCAGCGSGEGGKPAGCQSNGNCSSGGCNRLNVFNWLADIPISDLGAPFPIMEISFHRGSRKDFYRNNTRQIFEKGQLVVVEGSGGFDIGSVSLTGELVRWQMKKKKVKEDDAGIKKVLRVAGKHDLELLGHTQSIETQTLIRSRAIARSMKLEMKIATVEIQADGKKMSFFYTADSRVDFRELIKVYASEFKAKIEMRQIGARQESAKVGGIGSCGRELCCSTWLTDFKTVNTTAARYQGLSINQTKLSGQCGRLKCCLNFELDTYMDALKHFPKDAERLEFASGTAFLQKKDIFRDFMWYSFQGSNKQYPLTIDRVKEILIFNKKGEKPQDIGVAEVKSYRIKGDTESNIDMGFVNDVGQISLNSLAGASKKKKHKDRNRNKEKRNQPANKLQAHASGNRNAAESANKRSRRNNSNHNNRRKSSPDGAAEK